MRAAPKRIAAALIAAAAFASVAGVRRPALARPDTVKLLWKDPGLIASRDLYWGAGSEARAPKPPFTFVSETLSGTKPKIVLTDSAGVTWSAKFATVRPELNEVHAEIAATRIVWALGYYADENYFVPSGRIDGVKDLKRAAEVVGADGVFRTARFERRQEHAETFGEWNLEHNRFDGTRELAGLQTLMMLLANWDMRTANTKIIRVPLPSGDGDIEERYAVVDLGSTFGRMKSVGSHGPTRWNLADYSDTRYVDGVVMGRLQFRLPILGNAPLSVNLDHARWFAGLVSQLQERQVHQAFEASGASAQEIEGFSSQLLARIAALQSALNRF